MQNDRNKWPQSCGRLENRCTIDRVATHEFGFVRIESTRLHQHAVFDADLADVVQQTRQLDLVDLLFG